MNSVWRVPAEPEPGFATLDGRVDAGRALGVHAGRTAGQDDRLRVAREHLGDGHRVRHDLGVDPRLPHAPRDQLGVLGPEVDDEDQVVLCRLRHAAESIETSLPEIASGPDRGGRVIGP